jgi:hypothetical protein
MEWQFRLVSVYIKICELWETELFTNVQRMSNYKNLAITDQEIMTVYIFAIMQQHSTVKSIFQYASDHLREWFPTLAGYDAFLHRINFLAPSFQTLCERFSADLEKISDTSIFKVIDSLPIVLANNKRSNSAKVAPEFADKGYCASKDMYYYGVKLHTIGYLQNKGLPLPEFLIVSKASEHDLTVLKHVSPELYNCKLFADKAYCDKDFGLQLKEKQNVELHTPTKKIKGLFSFLGSDVMSTMISKIRQPIESFFNWIQEKTRIQTASKVRSARGLLVHIFGKLAAALMLMTTL